MHEVIEDILKKEFYSIKHSINSKIYFRETRKESIKNHQRFIGDLKTQLSENEKMIRDSRKKLKILADILGIEVTNDNA